MEYRLHKLIDIGSSSELSINLGDANSETMLKNTKKTVNNENPPKQK